LWQTSLLGNKQLLRRRIISSSYDTKKIHETTVAAAVATAAVTMITTSLGYYYYYYYYYNNDSSYFIHNDHKNHSPLRIDARNNNNNNTTTATAPPSSQSDPSIFATIMNTAASHCDPLLSINNGTLSSSSSSSAPQQHRHLLRTRQTLRQIEDQTTKGVTLESRYAVDWKVPLGEGSFGQVFYATDRITQEPVAVKKISKKFTKHRDFQLEMRALLRIRENGSHPNICGLRETYSEKTFYYLILDLIAGIEMFEHLVSNGAYSENECARLIREVASALSFLHGIGITHCDLKPENLMLSSLNPRCVCMRTIVRNNTGEEEAEETERGIRLTYSCGSHLVLLLTFFLIISDAVIKLIDFGCAQMDADDFEDTSLTGRTLAYCPPEVLDPKSPARHQRIQSSVDMWALGVILYIMLTGVHPFDLSGQASDEEVAETVVNGKPPPIRSSAITAHLSDSALSLIENLMQRDPEKRLTADQMLKHPWTQGVTAKTDKIADSDKKLSTYKLYKSGIAKKVFENLVVWSDDQDTADLSRRVSPIERSFRAFDSSRKGYIDKNDLRGYAPLGSEPDDQDSSRLSLSDFSDLLSENMKNQYFPKGAIVYREGDVGNAMYFINSGTVSIQAAGTIVKRGPGDFFGEGALLSPSKKRSATIKCETPVHVIELSRECFEDFFAQTDPEFMLMIREKDKIRKRNRVKMILRSQKNLVDRQYREGEFVFKKGDSGDSMYLVDSGLVHILENDNHVFTAKPGNIFGEHSLLTHRRRNCTALCGSEEGCIVKEMLGNDFRRAVASAPYVRETLKDLCIRREFKKAVVMRLKKEFPYDNPKEAFDAVKTTNVGKGLNFHDVANLMRELNPDYTDEEILEIISTLDLLNSGSITFDEFKKVFVADIRKSEAV
jgi:serine/threonine protein kinase